LYFQKFTGKQDTSRKTGLHGMYTVQLVEESINDTSHWR